MEVVGLLLKSGVSIDLDAGSKFEMITSEERQDYSTGLMPSQASVDERINLNSYVRIESVNHFRFTSKGFVWLMKESEVAGIKYKETKEKPQFKEEIKI